MRNDMGHFWSRFVSGTTTYTYRCNCCQHILQTNVDFMEIILPFPQDRSSISLNDSLNHDFGTEHMDNRLCKNCDNSNTSEVTTSIHTHPDVLIIMLQRNCWNINSERINAQVNFPLSDFVPNQGLDNDGMPSGYGLFAAVCHKESRNKTSGHFTAQCKIKGSNGYWIKYENADFELNNFINSRNRTRAKVKYHPLAYFLLFYIRRDPAVLLKIGLQVQEYNGVSQSRAGNHDDEQNHGDLVTNEHQDMSVHEDINQVDGTA
jgi:ubiquitin C-terminal hydrolase